MAQALQVEINALAISDNDARPRRRIMLSNVITGPGAFVMDVSDYAGFADGAPPQAHPRDQSRRRWPPRSRRRMVSPAD